MEQLTHNQLQNCEDILRQIEEEHRKYELLLKENEILNSKISAISISAKNDLIKDNVFKCLVKVFNSIFAVYDPLSDKISAHELETAIRCKSRKFYFLEIYVANSFQNRIIHQNWLINASLKNSREQISKSINVKSKITNPVCMLIPFGDSVEEAVLKVRIAWPEGQHWPYLQIADIPVDISYHFDVATSSSVRTINSKILQICKLNGIDIRYMNMNKMCHSQLYCNQDADSFLEKILRNSYHNLDLRHQATFSRANDVLIVKISIGNDDEVVIKLDTMNKILSIDANCTNLYLLKQYFSNELNLRGNSLGVESLRILKQWRTSLSDAVDYSTLRDIFLDLRRIVI